MRQLPAPATAEVGGISLEYCLAGNGRPTVVLVSGSGGPMLGWHRVFEALADRTTTLAYNRPGIGKSPAPGRPQTVTHMVQDLVELLARVGAPRPYVLVGHAFGGLVANLFARIHGDVVCGVLLLEATSPDDILLMKQHETRLQRNAGWLANRVFALNPNDEKHHATQSAAQMKTAPPFPPVPLRVLTGTKLTMAWATRPPAHELRAQHQRDLVRLSPHASHITAAASGHFPQLSEPDLVLSAVRELVGLGRRTA
jgi:pimeloyl-ACP methyl ester carboxylesterase